MFKGTVDGSFNQHTNKAAIAKVVKNNTGIQILSNAPSINAASELQTETLACLSAILMAVEQGFTYISIITNCLLLTQCLENDQLIPYPLINIFQDIRASASFFSYYNVSKVDRFEVQLVHKLALSMTHV